jgi:hypothetical protein
MALKGEDPEYTIIDEYKGAIVTCSIISIAVSLVYIFLIKIMPKIMVIVMTFVSLGLIALLCIIGIATANYGLAIPMGIMFLVYLLVIFCFRDKIRTGIVLVKVATNFISSKPVVFLTPVVKIILTTLFVSFWVYSLSLMN